MKKIKLPVFVTILGILLLGTATSGKLDDRYILKCGIVFTGLVYTLHGLYKTYVNIMRSEQY